MTVFETTKLLTLISRKFLVAVNSLNFLTEISVKNHVFTNFFQAPCYQKCLLVTFSSRFQPFFRLHNGNYASQFSATLEKLLESQLCKTADGFLRFLRTPIC